MRTDTNYRSFVPELIWPGFPNQLAANKLALLFQIEQNQWQPAEKIAARQFEQVKQVTAFAAATVPYYRRMLGSGFSAAGLTQQSWRDVPILTRKALHEAGKALGSENAPKNHGNVYSVSTSGSTGMVVEVLGNEVTKLYWQVFCLREHLWHRRDLNGTLCAIRYLNDAEHKGPNGIQAVGWGPASNDIDASGKVVAYHILHSIDHLAERIQIDRPQYLLSHPSMISGLATYFQEHSIEIPSLLEVRTLGESGDATLRELCQQVWKVPMVDMYTCNEAGYLALQCPDFPHYHVQSENVLVEVVDDNGMPCRAGEIGRVLITCLNNFASPLIRYEIGDYAEVGGPCPCGRGLPVLKRIMGRYRNLVTLPNGSRLWPRLGYESNLQAIAPIELMQIVQCELNAMDVRLVMPRALTETEQTALTNFIWKNFGYEFRLRFEYVDSIRNPVNGKIEQFISLIKPK